MKPEIVNIGFYVQEAARDVIDAGYPRGKDRTRATAIYYALCATAGRTESEPGPERPGSPFQSTLDQLGAMVCISPQIVARHIADFQRFGILDPRYAIPTNPAATFTLRLAEMVEPPMHIELLLPQEVKP